MKMILKSSKPHRVGVAIAASLLASSAFAQSSVTLFGVVDATVRYVKNGNATLTSIASGGGSSNRLGFRGTEDLGGGLQAEFWLESGFNVDTGSAVEAERLFNRRSTVSLVSKNAGELRLGRDFTPTYNAYAPADVFENNGIGALSAMINVLGSGALTNLRSDNEVSYILPGNLGGFFGQVSIAPGERTVGAKYRGGMVGWRDERVRLAAAYGVTSGVGEDEYKQMVLSGTFDLGTARIGALALQGQYRASKQHYYVVGFRIPVSEAGAVRGSYTLSDLKGPAITGQQLASADDFHRLALGYVYSLSKRSGVYVTGALLKNKGLSKISLAGGPPNTAGQTSNAIEFGLRHSF